MKLKIKNRLALNLTLWMLLGVMIISSGFYFVINMQTKDMQKRFFDKARLFSSILGTNLGKIVGDNLIAYRELQEATFLVKKTRKEIRKVRIIAPELTILSSSDATEAWRSLEEEYRRIADKVVQTKKPQSIVKTSPDKELVIHFMPLFEEGSHKIIGVMQAIVKFPYQSGQVAVSLRTNKTSYFRKEASSISISLAESLRYFISEAQRNFEYLKNIIGNMVTDEEVKDVKIFSRDLRILISGSLERKDILSDRDNSLYEKAMKERKLLFFKENRKGITEVISPLYLRRADKNEIGGAVDIVFSLNRLNSLISQRRNNILIMSITIVGMFCLIIILFFKGKVLNPLFEITTLTAKVSRGDFSSRVRVRSHDEIGKLAEAFNSMLEELQKYKEKVEQLNLKLKDKVDRVTEELEKKQAQLLESEKLASLGVLSSGIAHQINNPLGIILGNTQMLLRKLEQDSSGLKPEDIQELLTAVEENAKRCSRIVDSLLQFGRRKTPQFQRIDIAEVLNRALEFTNSHLSEKDIEVVKDFSSSFYSLADPVQLEQVFINIIINSEQSLEKSGQIRIKSDIKDYDSRKFIFITFHDNGRGISDDNLSKIFDPFFSTKEPGQGSGLGLSISYGIIKSHGGDIEISSKLGEGTTVVVKLPLKN